MKNIFPLLCLLAAVPASAACPQFFPKGQAPKVGRLLCNTGYAVGYSATNKTPLWSAEYLTDESVPKAEALPGRSTFFTDYRVPASSQTGGGDYKGGAYARGHMSPSGDQPDRQARIQTYLYSNVVPQDTGMNSGPWNQIEQATRQAALDDGEIYVVTGPIFPRVPDRLGPNHVAVPTALFKMVYDAMDGGVAAIICQNDTPAQCRQVNWRHLTATLGFDPMPGLSMHEKTSPLTIEGWSKVVRRSQY